ncbi:HAD-IC family P-type ATPase [Candidatus Uhrbacteria bacterium]|nr:HAD-IC family P-type ATPase [Candidatus Uhrbacteria bacterium]
MASWHTLSQKLLCQELETNLSSGLSSREAERRLRTYGVNALPEEKTEPLFMIFARQFASPLILVLFASAAVLFFLNHAGDAVIIFFVLLFNASIGTIHEGRSNQALRALKNFVRTTAQVLRDGRVDIVADTNLVPGDVILLTEGERVPADARIIESNGLRADESSLTGESIPVDKEDRPLKKIRASLPEQINMVFKGTTIVGGGGRAIVVKTGRSTEIGKVGTSISGLKGEIPLQKELGSLSRAILIGAAGIGALLLVLGLSSGMSPVEIFTVIVTLSVSVIPEGLPIVITLVLANGVWRMARRNALVKKLQAVETLGQAQVIAVDKTGTLTKNEMIVRSFFVNDAWFDISGTGYEPSGTLNRRDGSSVDPSADDGIRTLNRIAALTSNASVALDEKTNAWTVRGDPTEAAIAVLAKKIGLPREALEHGTPRVAELPFHYKEKYHATLHHGNNRYFINVAGAPEMILDRSQSIYEHKKIAALTDAKREHIEEEMRRASQQGLRVICFAFFQAPGNPLTLLEPTHITNLTFVGFYCLEDSLREEVHESVATAQSAGIRVVMLTGDHKTTAEAIATQAGIYHEGDRILTGDDIEGMTADELARALEKTTVFSRVTPDHKLKIIQGYKARNEIVAMTGDGVNDAPALVAADLGIGMGKIGTDVAKEASDIILLDDNFASIVSAVEEGRAIYRTTRKVILFLLGTNIGEIALIASSFFVDIPLPLLPAQIIWLNLVTDSFLDVSLGMEPKERGLLSGAFTRGRSLIDRSMIPRMMTMSLPAAAGALILFSLTFQDDIARAGTLTLTTIAIAQWFNAWNCRSERTSLFRANPFSNRYLVGALGIVGALQLAAVYAPPLQAVLHTVPLTAGDWLVCIGVASSVIVAEELRKLFSQIKIHHLSQKPIS